MLLKHENLYSVGLQFYVFAMHLRSILNDKYLFCWCDQLCVHIFTPFQTSSWEDI